MCREFKAVLIAIQFAAAICYAQAPDTLWTRIYGGPERDFGDCVRQTYDEGYIIVGRTESYGMGYTDVYLIKTTSEGDTSWTRTFGGEGYDQGYEVLQTPDSGFIVVGSTTSFNADWRDFYIFKTNSSGDTLWTRIYGGPYYDEAVSIRLVSANEYIVAGILSAEDWSYDIWLLKIDGNGDTLWTKTYGWPEDDVVSCVQNCSDGGYILTGWTNSMGAGGQDVLLIRTDSNGDTLWTKTLGGEGADLGAAVLETPDSCFLIAGFTDSYGSGSGDGYVVKYNQNGDTLWTQTYGGDSYDRFADVIETPDGNYLAVGFSYSSISLDDAFLVKFDGEGNVIWTGIIGNTGWDDGYCISNVLGGGYIMTGHTRSYNYWADVWLVNIAPDITGIETESEHLILRDFVLRPNYPNPFNTSTTIDFVTHKSGIIRLAAYDLLGRRVKTLINGYLQAGSHSITFDASGLSSGVYFYRLESGNKTETEKMVLLK